MNQYLSVRVQVDGPSQEEAGAGFGRAWMLTEPSHDHPDRGFRGIWAQRKSGARFARKRLMRMNHRLPSEDVR